MSSVYTFRARRDQIEAQYRRLSEYRDREIYKEQYSDGVRQKERVNIEASENLKYDRINEGERFKEAIVTRIEESEESRKDFRENAFRTGLTIDTIA